MAGEIQIGGLASGLDTGAIIDALVDVERNRIRLVERQQAAYDLRLSAYGSLASRLGSFQTITEKMNEAESFDLFTGTTTEEDNVTIEGSSGAVDGDYAVVISQKAQAETLSSLASRITSETGALLGAGDSATITLNGVDISVDDTDTVRDLMLRINNATDAGGESIGVNASVLKVADSDYRLVLTSEDEGAGNEIVMSDSGGTVNLLQDELGILNGAGQKGNIDHAYDYTVADENAVGVFIFEGKDHNGNDVNGTFALTGNASDLEIWLEAQYNQTVDVTIGAGAMTITDKTTGESSFEFSTTNPGLSDGGLGLGAEAITTGTTGASTVKVAQDAFFTLNGIAVQSDSNTADEVVTGVTFNLLKADATKEIGLSLEHDYDGVKALVAEFIDGYNTVLDYITTNSKYSTSTEPGEEGEGIDGPFSSDWTISRLKSDLRSIITTQFTEWGVGNNNNALVRIGIKSNAQTGRLEIDDDTFKDVFNNDFDSIARMFTPNGTSSSANISFGRATTDTENGSYDIERLTDDSYRIRKDGGAWYTSDARNPGVDVIHWSDGPADGLSMTIPIGNLDNATFVYTKGIGEMMYQKLDEVTDKFDGYISTSQTSIKNRIESFEDRIAYLERSLESYRLRLVSQFSELEKTMSMLQSQNVSLSSSLGAFG